MYQSKKITEGALLLAIFFAILLLSFFVPFIILFAVFLLPIPFVIYTAKYDWKIASILLAIAILLSLLIAPMISLPLTVLVGLAGIMIGFSIYRRSSAYETWARGSIGFIAGLLFIFLFSQFVWQINWSEEIQQLVEESMNVSQEFFAQFGIEEQTETLDMLEDQFKILIDLIPAMISIVAIILAFITQWISYKVMNRFQNWQLHFPPFRSLRFPTPIIWIYFFTIILMLVIQDVDSILYVGSYNLFMIIGFFMALQGFSFIFFFAHYKNMSHVLPVTSVIVTILFPFIFLYIIRILGIIDIGFKLRERLSERK